MDKQTYEQIDRIEDKLDLVLDDFYEQDKEGNLKLKNKQQKKEDKEESYAAE